MRKDGRFDSKLIKWLNAELGKTLRERKKFSL